MSITPKFLNWEECDWREAREKIRGKCFQGNDVTLQIGEIWPGHTPGPHSHSYEQTVMILGGECDFYVDGVPYPLSAGCVMTVPPDVEHYIVAKGTGPVYNLDIFTPRRPDRVESVPRKKP